MDPIGSDNHREAHVTTIFFFVSIACTLGLLTGFLIAEARLREANEYIEHLEEDLQPPTR